MTILGILIQLTLKNQDTRQKKHIYCPNMHKGASIQTTPKYKIWLLTQPI